MTNNRPQIHGEIARMFSAFERGIQPERAARYVESLQRVPIERLERAVSWVIEHWEEKSPPTIAKLRSIAWRGEPGTTADDDAARERAKVLRAYLAAYSDEDQHEWQLAFGYIPTRAMFDRMEVPVPKRVAFRFISKAECDAARSEAREDCRRSFNRLSEKYHASLPAPELLSRPQADEELPF